MTLPAHDSRSPRIVVGVPLTDRLTAMVAMSFAFPLVKNDPTWKARVDAILSELNPTAEEHAEIVAKAVKISDQLKRELAVMTKSD